MHQAKPLFTGEFVAFSEFDRQALKTLLRELSQPSPRVVEVGSWLGNGSTRTLVEELAGRGVLLCVDHWRGNANVQRHQELADRYDTFATFQANVASYPGGDVVKPLVLSSRDAAAVLADGAFDLVFIDADHSYDQTRADLALWWPKVAPGGILCGHDCEGRPGHFGREWLWANRQEDSLAWQGRFVRIHPGPILAVEARFGGAARLFADAPVRLADGSEGYSSVWAVRKPRPWSGRPDGLVVSLGGIGGRVESMICADTLDLFVVHAWRYHADWRRVAALLDAHAPRGWRNFSLPWYDPALDARTPDGGQKVRWHLESQIIPAHAVLLLAGVWREPGTHKWLSFEIEAARKHGKPIFALPSWGEADVPADVVEQADAVVAWDAEAIFAAARTDRRQEAPAG